MQKLPECRSMNFSIYSGMLERYKDSGDIRQSYTNCGLNGLEVIRAGESDRGMIHSDMVNGVHLYFHIFWMDWWLGNYERLDAEFDSREQWIEYFGGMDRNVYLDALRADMDYAQAMGAKYVVFHVSEVTLRESFTYEYKYTDEEVIDASIEVINAALKGKNYTFDFLVENLWWSGLTMKSPELTKKLVDGIEYENKGIMLDIGHYMNTDCDLKTPEDAVVYVHEMLDTHEPYDMNRWIKGIHLQMSLGGEYVKKQKKDWAEHPLDFDKIPFYELFTVAYKHACDIDLHVPFIGEGVKELIERIDPEYVTFEFQPGTREEYEAYAKAQSEVLGYL